MARGKDEQMTMVDEHVTMGVCTDPEHEGPKLVANTALTYYPHVPAGAEHPPREVPPLHMGRYLTPPDGPRFFACMECLRRRAQKGEIPPWAARLMDAPPEK
jgi:hypothetical protein